MTPTQYDQERTTIVTGCSCQPPITVRAHPGDMGAGLRAVRKCRARGCSCGMCEASTPERLAQPREKREW